MSSQVLMLGGCLTWPRAPWLPQVLLLDQNIQFPQLMGYVVVGLSLVHTVAHVVSFGEWPGAGGEDLGGPFPSPGHGAQPLCVLRAQWVGKGCLVSASGLDGSLYPCGCLTGRGGAPEGTAEREKLALCSSPALQAQSEASAFRFWELLLTARPGIGWVRGSASPTGACLLHLLCPEGRPLAPLLSQAQLPSHFLQSPGGAQADLHIMCVCFGVCRWVVVYVCQVENVLLWKILPFCWPAPCPNWIRL